PQVLIRNKGAATLNKITWPGQTDSATNLQLKYNELYTFKHKELLPENTPYSNPYWLNHPHSNAQYVIDNQLLVGKPENAPPEEVTFNIDIDGLTLNVQRPVVYKYT